MGDGGIRCNPWPSSYGGDRRGETPLEGRFSVPIEWRQIIRQGDFQRRPHR